MRFCERTQIFDSVLLKVRAGGYGLCPHPFPWLGDLEFPAHAKERSKGIIGSRPDYVIYSGQKRGLPHHPTAQLLPGEGRTLIV